MNTINYDFFEEYKRLEKLCSDIYKSPNGITHYIDDMKAVSYFNYHTILNWESDLKQLKKLRYIRNYLAHTEGAFNENVCSSSDVAWIKNFIERILNQSDPLAVHYRNSKIHINTTPIIIKNAEVQKQVNNYNNYSLSLIILITITAVIIAAVIIALLLH